MSHSRRRSWQQPLVRSWPGARVIRKAPAQCPLFLEALEDRAARAVRFAAAVPYNASPRSAPGSVTTADLIGDGRLDPLTADSSSKSISVQVGCKRQIFWVVFQFALCPSGLHPNSPPQSSRKPIASGRFSLPLTCNSQKNVGALLRRFSA